MPFKLTPLTIAVALIMGILSAVIAHRRKRNPYAWFFVGFFFGLIGILAIFFIAPKKASRKSAPAPAAPPRPRLAGPTNKFWYYLDPAHAQQGPMSFDALSRAFGQGKISSSTYVWHEDLPEWKPLQEFLKI